jgi:subtilisin family serine protease
VANGITYAADNGAKVINLSLGGGGSSTLQSAVDYAWNKGSFLACAAGNENTSGTAYAYPGAYDNCFAVASTTLSDTRSSFSNYGTWVEAAAPGSSIYSTWINSGYDTIDGTSMATPHVAGLAGLLASQGLTNAQIRQRICDSSDKIDGTGTTWTCGRINAARAVRNETTPPPATANAIVNGGFESGTSSWAQSSSTGYQLIGTTWPRSGAYGAYLGDYNYAKESISQTITIPSGGKLSYWWYMTTREAYHPYDFLYVRLYTTSGSLVKTLRTWSDASGAGVWRQDTLDLSAYAGRTLRMQFYATNDNSAPTGFFVDDVSVK